MVEKLTHKLHLYKNESGRPRLVRSMRIATGKKSGDKLIRGDHRTPEGIYQLTEFLTHDNLVAKYGKEGEIYGVGAFVLNYPNPIDSSLRKTGGGIWIHSTNDETRIEKGLDSRGCVVTANNELIDLSQYIELNKTPVVIIQNMNFISEDAWKLERGHLLDFLNSWANAWRNEGIPLKYFTHYDRDRFRDPIRGNFARFEAYKKAVFLGPGKTFYRYKGCLDHQNPRLCRDLL